MSPRLPLRSDRCLAVPGVYDGLSARLAEAAGFEALYLTGYGVSASLLGKPDAGFLTRAHMVDRIAAIRAVTRIPLIADADTGFGNVQEVAETVRAYEDSGAAALQLEDQVFPKRCGHTPGRAVLPLDEAVAKLDAALDARRDPAFRIVARTDARTGDGLDAAIARAAAFHDAGADVLFVESPESEDELARIAAALPDAVLCANMVEGGRTPFLGPDRLAEMGYAIAIYPLIGLSAAAGAVSAAYGALVEGAPNSAGSMPFADLNHAVGFEQIWADDTPDPRGPAGG